MKNDIDAEYTVSGLKEAAEFYKPFAACPFKPGDIITPREGYGNFLDTLYLVVETREAPEPAFNVSDSYGEGGLFGGRYDVRAVAYTEDNELFLYWVESFYFKLAETE